MVTITVGDVVVYVESDEVEFADDDFEYDEEGIAWSFDEDEGIWYWYSEDDDEWYADEFDYFEDEV